MELFIALLTTLILGIFSGKIIEIANNHQKQVKTKNINPMFYVVLGILSLIGLYWLLDIISKSALEFGLVNASVKNVPVILFLVIPLLFTYLIYMKINKIQ